MSAPPRFKVVELSTVTDDNLEREVNDWSAKGWILEMVHYVTQPSSRRPVMAFLYFIESPGGATPG